MKRWSLFLMVVVALLGVFSTDAQGGQCVVGRALVLNGTEDQTQAVRAGIVYEVNGNLGFATPGELVEILPGHEVEVFTPETILPPGANPIEVYLSGASSETGVVYGSIAPCAVAPAPGGAANGAPTFTDGRINPNGADTAVIYASGDEYAVWGVDPSGTGFEAFTFTCAELQDILDEAQPESNGNYLLESALAPGRNGDIQLWVVPGNGRNLGLVLVSPGQGGDNSKQTIVPLTSLCPDLS